MRMEEKSNYTRYEKARILGARALQISANAPILIKLSEEQLEKINYDPIQIAELEFEENILPITVKRPLPKRIAEKLIEPEEVEVVKEVEAVKEEKEMPKSKPLPETPVVADGPSVKEAGQSEKTAESKESEITEESLAKEIEEAGEESEESEEVE